MGRYSKLYSNYILRKRHQAVEGGTIFERDWGTLGERHVIEPGKKRVYGDSNFLFTDNTRSGNRYRNNTGEWSEPYTQDTIGDKVDSTVNDTTILDNSNDIRDYAYYGSAVELVRTSIENIVKWFPGRFWSEDEHFACFGMEVEPLYIRRIVSDGHHNYAVEYTDTNDDGCSIFTVSNPFTIDFYTTNNVLGKYDNPLRNMPFSFKRYLINGHPIKSWDVWIRPYSECVERYTIKYDITFTYDDNSLTQTGHLYGFAVGGDIVWGTTLKNMNVQPEDNAIDEYFLSLDGFEARLLDRSRNPIYSVSLVTPVPMGNNIPDYIYTPRTYVWPHSGYCIDVDSIYFERYVGDLYDLARTMDEVWCDNIWRSMTHEPIVNFDWTYSRQYEDGQETESILGGTRMEGILRIWGRCYDDIKRYVDAIKLKNCITYDNSRQNLGNAELSDKASLLGWEIRSTKLNNDGNIYLTQDFLDNYIGKLDQDERWDCSESNNAECGAYVSYGKWYDTRNIGQVSQNSVDNDFMKRLVLSTGEIFRTKGTKQAIEMVFGLFGIGNHDEEHPDFEFTEKYYTVTPKRRDDEFWYYEIQDFLKIKTYEYTAPEGEYNSLEEYLEDNPADENSIEKLAVGGNYYDLKSMTVGEFCEYIVSNKVFQLNYADDEFSGSPIKDVFINNEHYIVPYFTSDRIYDGNIHFETRGGWGKSVEPGYDSDVVKEQEFDYLETIPYMETIQNVSSLLLVNPYSVNYKRIFYVMNLSDLTDYVQTIPDNISHLFKLAEPNSPNSFSSWKNIPSDGYADPSYDIFSGVTEDDIRLARYCESLKFGNFGNNPHCGYGAYDLGNEYLEHLRMPFKYLVDHYSFSTDEALSAASQFKFEVTEHTGEKIVNRTGYDGIEYILPSKMLTITNNIHNRYYKEYLDNVVMKYVLQVIPSTTILVLEDGTYNDVGHFYLVVDEIPQTVSIDEMERTDEAVIDLGSNISSLTLVAVPENRSVTLEYESNGLLSKVTECDEQPCLVRIADSCVAGLPTGYKVLQYYFNNINVEISHIIIQ